MKKEIPMQADPMYTNSVNTGARTTDAFLIGRDGRLHDSAALVPECRLDGATFIPVSTLEEVEKLSLLVKVKLCVFCADGSEVGVFWQRWLERSQTDS